MKKIVIFLLVGLLACRVVSDAGRVFERTEIIDLGKEIGETIKAARIKIKPHIKKEREASSALRKKLTQYRKTKDPHEKLLVWSEVEVYTAKMLKETVGALETLEYAVSSLSGSLIKLNSMLMREGRVKASEIEHMNKLMANKMEQLGELVAQTANVSTKYIQDHRVKARVMKALQSIRQKEINNKKLKSRVRSVRKIARKRILESLEMQTELQNLLKIYKDEAMWRSFISKLRLVDVVLNEAERSLHLDDAGKAFITEVEGLKANMSAIEEVRYMDEVNNYNLFNDVEDEPAFNYNPDYVDEELRKFSKYGLKEPEK